MKHALFIFCLCISLCTMGQSANFGNTAENYCKLLGYDLVIDPATNRTACKLPNGELVNPWDFLKGKVGQEYSYCAKKGYTIRTKKIEHNGAYYAIPICDKENGKSVSLMELLSKNQKYNELYRDDLSSSELFDTVLFNDQQRRPPTPECKGSDQGYATSLDWRNIDGENFVNPPGNQENTRLCYAFASASVAESVLAITEDTPYGSGMHDFSEAFLGYMGSYFPSANPIPPYIWFAIRGYVGLQQTFRHQICEKLCANGVVEEDDFPLVIDSITGRIVDSVFTEWGADRYRFTSWDTVDSTVTAIKDALHDGPVLASMYYDYDTHVGYEGGILTGSNEPGTTHMVVIVGWDVYINDMAEECEFWIVKNSYDDNWGGLGNGYMHVSTNFCLRINNHVLKLEYNVPSIEGSYLACENQTISNISSYAGTGYHRPDPYTLFNGYTSDDEWTFGSTANLSAKSTSSEEATIIFKVPFTNYVQCDTTIDPDFWEYYQKQVWAGIPVAPTVTGSTLIGCYEPTWYYAYANSSSGSCTAESFTWEISSGLQLQNTYSNPARIRVQATGTGNYVVKSFATNHVGTDSTYYNIQAFCVAPLINAFPNPASNELNVEITTSEDYEPDFEIDLIDSANKKWKTINTKNKATTIFVGDIPKGSYILRISILINGKKAEEKNKNIMII